MFKSQNGLAHILLILILLVGIIAGVFLVGKTQIFKPKATASSIEFLDNSCIKVQNGTKVLTCEKVKFKLTSPLETGQTTDNSSNKSLVKTAYAAEGDKFCKSDIDPESIYHKEKFCNQILGFICFTWLSSHDEDVPEPCGTNQKCVETTPDLFKTVARCVDFSNDQTRNLQPSTFIQPDIYPQPDQPASGGLPVPAGDQPIQPVTPPVSSPDQGAQPVVTPPTPAPTSQAAPDPAPPPAPPPPPPAAAPPPAAGGNAGTGATAPNTGTGATNPTARTTAKFKYAENPAKLLTAAWLPYTVGGVTIDDFTFSDKTPGPKFIYAQFQDNQLQIIKFSNGQEFTSVQIDLIAPSSASPSSTASPTPSPTPTPTPTPTLPAEERVTIGTASVNSPATASSGQPVALTINIAGFSTPGRSIVGLFFRNQVGECSIQKDDCGYIGWTQLRSYGTNGTDTNAWTSPSSIAVGFHMFGVFSLNRDKTAGQLMGVSPTNFQ